MHSRRHALHTCVIALALLGACDVSFNSGIDKTKAEALVKSLLTKENITPTSVTCPEKQENKKGVKFECTAVANGTDVHFSMEVIDDEGSVMATPRDHTLVVASVEPEIKADLQAKGHQVAKIDCHGDVWVAVKGATVTCDLVDETGKEYLWSATFTDDKGTHEHSVKAK
jgi:Fe-S cluster biogenesis protein NfuA